MSEFAELEGKTVVACDVIESGQTLCVALADGSEFQIFGDINHQIQIVETKSAEATA